MLRRHFNIRYRELIYLVTPYSASFCGLSATIFISFCLLYFEKKQNFPPNLVPQLQLSIDDTCLNNKREVIIV